jgi:hypothetical protein
VGDRRSLRAVAQQPAGETAGCLRDLRVSERKS